MATAHIKSTISNVLHGNKREPKNEASGTDAEVALDGEPTSTSLGGTASGVIIHKIGYGLMMMSTLECSFCP